MKFGLLFFPLLAQLIACQLQDTGLRYDESTKSSGYLVFTSRVKLPDTASKLYDTFEQLLALAIQGFDDMERICKQQEWKMGNPCPKSMTVFAIGDELYFGSSVKNFGRRENRALYISFMIESNAQSSHSRSGAARRVQRHMLQCQTQQTLLEPKQHSHNGMCGEFTPIFLYLSTQSEPQQADLAQGRIITYGLSESGKNYFPPCQNGQSKYGCRNWVGAMGIHWGGYQMGAAKTIDDPGSTVDNVDLCEVGNDDDDFFGDIADEDMMGADGADDTDSSDLFGSMADEDMMDLD